MISSNVLCWAGHHDQEFFLLRRSGRGLVFSARLGMNFPSCWTMPLNSLICVIFVGSLNSAITLIFFGLADTPYSLMIWPKNGTEEAAKMHLLSFKILPLLGFLLVPHGGVVHVLLLCSYAPENHPSYKLFLEDLREPGICIFGIPQGTANSKWKTVEKIPAIWHDEAL